PQKESNQTQQLLNTALEGVSPGDTGPIEGRPPGPIWAHQQFERFAPKVGVEVEQAGAKILGPSQNTLYNPGCDSQFNSGIDASADVRPTFHPQMPDQSPLNFWSFNVEATDPRCGSPDGSGGINKMPGDWRETMSTHWFHDHMFSFTSQNVYKGNAGMFNLYSSLDRGNEAINDGVNLRLPSGTAKDWGNLDYDVNLMLADKAWDPTFPAQLYFNIFNFDGLLGDRMTVNLVDNPYFD